MPKRKLARRSEDPRSSTKNKRRHARCQITNKQRNIKKENHLQNNAMIKGEKSKMKKYLVLEDLTVLRQSQIKGNKAASVNDSEMKLYWVGQQAEFNDSDAKQLLEQGAIKEIEQESNPKRQTKIEEESNLKRQTVKENIANDKKI